MGKIYLDENTIEKLKENENNRQGKHIAVIPICLIRW